MMFVGVGTINITDFVYINWCSVDNTVELANFFFVYCVGLDSQRAHVLDCAIVTATIGPY